MQISLLVYFPLIVSLIGDCAQQIITIIIHYLEQVLTVLPPTVSTISRRIVSAPLKHWKKGIMADLCPLQQLVPSGQTSPLLLWWQKWLEPTVLVNEVPQKILAKKRKIISINTHNLLCIILPTLCLVMSQLLIAFLLVMALYCSLCSSYTSQCLWLLFHLGPLSYPTVCWLVYSIFSRKHCHQKKIDHHRSQSVQDERINGTSYKEVVNLYWICLAWNKYSNETV